MSESSERERLDASLVSRGLGPEVRAALWSSVDSILSHGPTVNEAAGRTGLALGYVQSGKTTAITALVAAAADSGYRVVIALMGSTNLLLDQNWNRLHDALELAQRQDYRWVSIANPGSGKGTEIRSWLERGRVVLLPVLKHAGRIDSLVLALTSAQVDGLPVLIVDDEADQASLNTDARRGQESRTYAAISALRKTVPHHLYVQFTATPYAPLLLEPEDHLRPDFVELLHPGPGYTGGREFFVDHAPVVVRPIPTIDEQPPRTLPTQLTKSLVKALASFVAGTALLLGEDAEAAPVSMLVHSTQRNDVQARYHFLLQRLVKKWSGTVRNAESLDAIPTEILDERRRIVACGATDLNDSDLLSKTKLVLGEITFWLVNSTSDVSKVDWNVAPVHVLVGGNKLDRGFTVEGLTVTYMNRPPSDQVDTLEQRARAFGYRADLLPYCQFFATPRTLKVLKEIVDTEYDLRARLRDWLADGHDVSSWAREIGLLLPTGTRPTRQTVLAALTRFNERPTWHQLRRPAIDHDSRDANAALVAQLGLLDAPEVSFGRLSHPTLQVPLSRIYNDLLSRWTGAQTGSSPGWRHDEILSLLARLAEAEDPSIPVILMRRPDDQPRQREWDNELGFINLMQGADPVRPGERSPYPGDRAVGGVLDDPDQVVVQIHHVQSRPPGRVPPLFTLAVHAGSRSVTRKA